MSGNVENQFVGRLLFFLVSVFVFFWDRSGFFFGGFRVIGSRRRTARNYAIFTLIVWLKIAVYEQILDLETPDS